MSNIPDGHVAVEVILNEDGTYETKIIGHGSNTSCLHEDDDGILRELEGEMGDSSAYGRTEEYYEETAPKFRPKPFSPPDQDNSKRPYGQNKNKQKINMGFGV